MRSPGNAPGYEDSPGAFATVTLVPLKAVMADRGSMRDRSVMVLTLNPGLALSTDWRARGCAPFHPKGRLTVPGITRSVTCAGTRPDPLGVLSIAGSPSWMPRGAASCGWISSTHWSGPLTSDSTLRRLVLKNRSWRRLVSTSVPGSPGSGLLSRESAAWAMRLNSFRTRCGARVMRPFFPSAF